MVGPSDDLSVGEWWSETGGRPGKLADATRFPFSPAALGLLTLTADGVVIDCCKNAARMLGYDAQALRNVPLASIVPGLTCVAALQRYALQFGTRSGWAGPELELPVRRRDGSTFAAMLAPAELSAAHGDTCHLLIHDVSAWQAARAQAERLSAAVAQTADAIVITDRQGAIQYANRAFEESTGYTLDEVMGRTMAILKSGRHGAEFYAKLYETVLSGRIFRARFANRHKNGELVYQDQSISPVRDALGNIVSFVSTAKDVSARVRAEERLFLLANYDPVTGLPNRNLLLDRLNHALALSQRRGEGLALLHLDLDRFRLINDTLGHRAGDALLHAIGHRLRGCVRQADTVARVGGDEFVIALAQLAAEDDVNPVLDKISQAFLAPFAADGREIYVTASTGVSLCPRDTSEVQRMLQYADLAMFQAKAAGRNRCVFFDRSMDSAASERHELATALRGALRRDEFTLEYQPQIEVQSGRMIAVEALLRWRHPLHGAVGPDRFVPLLEDLGTIGEISAWAIGTACRQIQALPDTDPPLSVAINLCYQQFADPQLPALVDQALARTGLAPDRLEFEITERTLMEDLPTTGAALAALAARGIGIAIDDFGVGYSSLSYLKRFPVSAIKIDRSFIWDATRDADAAAIVRAVVSLGRDLGLTVIAEGVETADQFEFLRALHCARVQGYLFSRPLTYDALRDGLNQPTPSDSARRGAAA